MHLPPTTSWTIDIVFLTIVVVVAAALPLGVWRASLRLGDTRDTARRRATRAASGLGVVAAVGVALGWSGVFGRFDVLPPPVMFYVFGMLGVTAWLAFGGFGQRLLSGLPIAALIGFQVFRVPLEVVLHALHSEGALPVQMTYAGLNFDIISGALAGVVGLWAWRRRGESPPPRWAVWVYNVVGIALLVNIVTVAILSMPVPFRQFTGAPNTLVISPLYVLLPGIMVQAAFFGHFLVFRWLWQTRAERVTSSPSPLT